MMARSENETFPEPQRQHPAAAIAARELEGLERSLSEAVRYTKADRPDVADYLRAVRHGIALGRLRLYGIKVGNTGIA